MFQRAFYKLYTNNSNETSRFSIGRFDSGETDVEETYNRHSSRD